MECQSYLGQRSSKRLSSWKNTQSELLEEEGKGLCTVKVQREGVVGIPVFFTEYKHELWCWTYLTFPLERVYIHLKFLDVSEMGQNFDIVESEVAVVRCKYIQKKGGEGGHCQLYIKSLRFSAMLPITENMS